MNCSHNWTVTSECPRCLRAALDRAETERAQAQRELSARAARPLAIRQRDEAVARAEAAEARVAKLETALTKINAIRDSIVGVQGFNFSEHAYPLVAALNEAGFEGLPYPEARENVGTLIERANRAEARVAELETENARLLEIATDARIDRTQLRAVRDAAEAVCNDSQGVDAICEGVLKRRAQRRSRSQEGRGQVTWIIKRGRFEYVFADSLGPALDWTDMQTLAHRFADRNAAAAVVGRMPASVDNVRVVRLVSRGKGE